MRIELPPDDVFASPQPSPSPQQRRYNNVAASPSTRLRASAPDDAGYSPASEKRARLHTQVSLPVFQPGNYSFLYSFAPRTPQARSRRPATALGAISTTKRGEVGEVGRHVDVCDGHDDRQHQQRWARVRPGSCPLPAEREGSMEQRRPNSPLPGMAFMFPLKAPVPAQSVPVTTTNTWRSIHGSSRAVECKPVGGREWEICSCKYDRHEQVEAEEEEDAEVVARSEDQMRAQAKPEEKKDSALETDINSPKTTRLSLDQLSPRSLASLCATGDSHALECFRTSLNNLRKGRKFFTSAGSCRPTQAWLELPNAEPRVRRAVGPVLGGAWMDMIARVVNGKYSSVAEGERGEQERQMQQTVGAYMKLIMEVFDHYRQLDVLLYRVSQTDTTQTPTMSMAQFWRLARECGLAGTRAVSMGAAARALLGLGTGGEGGGGASAHAQRWSAVARKGLHSDSLSSGAESPPYPDSPSATVSPHDQRPATSPASTAAAAVASLFDSLRSGPRWSRSAGDGRGSLAGDGSDGVLWTRRERERRIDAATFVEYLLRLAQLKHAQLATLSQQWSAVFDHDIRPNACKPMSSFAGAVASSDVYTILETNEAKLLKVFRYFIADKSKARRPGGPTMSFNEYYQMMMDLDMMDAKLDPRAVARVFTKSTGYTDILPQVHANNSESEMTFDEYVESLLHCACLYRHAGDNSGGAHNSMPTTVHDWLLRKYLPTAKEKLPGRL
eukprot:jgi/Chlat1/1420/Chrsp12S01981